MPSSLGERAARLEPPDAPAPRPTPRASLRGLHAPPLSPAPSCSDLCPICLDDLTLPAPGEAEQLTLDGVRPSYAVHCRWGCGKAVHRACAASWERNACVICAAPMS